ncbi:Uncharacterized protein HZ326_4905 [Fusarium oxysporum f. sp. albedinis]|nr:Uncharacterized protein HZ326_4905 [Fusarium oxysporum f. sp. albedinis]
MYKSECLRLKKEELQGQTTNDTFLVELCTRHVVLIRQGFGWQREHRYPATASLLLCILFGVFSVSGSLEIQ